MHDPQCERRRVTTKVRKIFDGFEAYGWETPTHEIAKKVGLKDEQIVRLDTNASPFAPLDELKLLSKKAPMLQVNQYPDTTYLGIRKGLAAYCGIGVDRFVVTNGADEGLDIIGKTLLDNGDEVVVPVPTYAMFRIVSEVMGARMRYVRRNPVDHSVSADEVLGAVGPKTKLIFLCNPNSPTGNPMPLAEVERIVKDAEVAVAVDEAYYEFWGKTAAGLTEKHDNLIVCRTFSKAFSMAGVRVGYLVAQGKTVDLLNVVRPPNSLSVISIMLAESALRNLGEMRGNVRKIVAERGRVFKALRKIGSVVPFPTETNFVLFKVDGGAPTARRLHSALMKRGFVLRSYSSQSGIGDCLRLTVGTREVNERFLSALGEVS
ncbi:MAG TPA: histidinol-phosphate transaminase [Nitrososphaerales archaeon]|nr:histidinol-phosphate transaminase [Nitrososphaerales archaeon]